MQSDIVDVRDYMEAEELERALASDSNNFSLPPKSGKGKSKTRNRESFEKIIEMESNVKSISLFDIELAISQAKSSEARARLRALLVIKKKLLKQEQEARVGKKTEKDLEIKSRRSGKWFGRRHYHNRGRAFMKRRGIGPYARNR